CAASCLLSYSPLPCSPLPPHPCCSRRRSLMPTSGSPAAANTPAKAN
ncbi:MAG: hypothetical protein AVDCRST_MAG77-3212, partial [uncultured Chloroflexi bacterium]